MSEFDKFIENIRNILQSNPDYGVWVGQFLTPPSAPGDTDAPLVISLSPENGAFDVLAGTVPEIEFNERIRFSASGTINIIDQSTGLAVKTYTLPSDAGLQIIDDTKVRLLNAGLVLNKVYYITISSGAIEDLAGNDFAGFATSANWAFVMDQDIAYTVLPPDGSTNVGLNVVIAVTFSENVTFQTGLITLKDSTTNQVYNTYDMTNPAQVSPAGAGRQLMIWSPGFQVGKDYDVTIPAGAVRDAQGNFNTEITWSFSTIGDAQAPVPLAYNPQTGATGVSLDLTATIEYSEAITPGTTQEITVYRYDNDVEISVKTAADLVQLAPNRVQISFALPANTEVYILADAGLIKDASSNNSAAISNKNTWKFTTSNPCAGTVFPAHSAMYNEFQIADNGTNFVITWTGNNA